VFFGNETTVLDCRLCFVTARGESQQLLLKSSDVCGGIRFVQIIEPHC